MKAMVVFELQHNNTFRATTVYQATPGKLFGKTLPGDPIREQNVAAILATAKAPDARRLQDHRPSGACEADPEALRA
jgi:hypothetical protein